MSMPIQQEVTLASVQCKTIWEPKLLKTPQKTEEEDKTNI